MMNGQLCSRLILLCLIFAEVSSLDPYTFISNSSTFTAHKGGSFEIPCRAYNRPDSLSVQWEREAADCPTTQSCGVILAQGKLPNDQQKYGLRFVPTETYILVIKNVDERDEGRYYCQLSLSVYSVKATDMIYLRIVEKPFIDSLRTSLDKFVEIGQDVELTCAAYGQPKPLIKWTRAGNAMMPGGGYIRLSETLSIRNVQPEHRGQYICSATTHGVGEDHRIINIDMDFEPRAKANPAEAVQKIGYETRLYCHVSSQPVSKVTWFIGQNAVSGDSTKYKVTSVQAAFSNVISKLIVYSVSDTEVNANIRCFAKNKAGTGQASFKIKASDNVKPIPGASSSSHHITLTLPLFLLSCMSALSLS